MPRGTRARWTGLPAVALAVALVLAGCGGGEHGSSRAGPPSRPSPSLLRIDASLHVPSAGIVVSTPDRLWVISGGTNVVTQIDPGTTSITRRVELPHPVAYGTVAHGSLWLVSEGDNAVIELDAESGTIRRTLERSPRLPLNDPVGIAVTGHSLWVVNHHDSAVLRLDGRSGTLLHTTKLPGDAAARTLPRR